MLLWISSIAFLLMGTWRAGLLQQVKSWPRGETLAVVGLFLAGYLARGTLTSEIPWVLAGDEASGGLYAVDFVRGQRDNPFGVGFLSFPSLYFFMQSLSIRLFGQTTEALRLPSALVGALTVPATYWFLREAFGRGVALAGAAYLSAFHFHIHFSRLGLNNIWDGLFLTLTAAAFWRGWKGGGRMSFALAGLSVGLAQYFYVGSRVLYLLFPFWLAVAFVRDRKTARARLSGLAIGALAAFVVALPLMLFYLDFPGDFLAPYSRVSLIGPLLENAVQTSGEPVWRILADQLKTSALAFTGTNLRYWYQPGYPMLLPVPSTIFLMGICLILLRLAYLPELTVGLWIAGAIIVGAMSDSTPAAQRYVFAAPAVAAVIALPLERGADWFSTAWPGARRVILAALGGVLLLGAWQDLRFYFGEYSANLRFADNNTEVATRVGDYLAGIETDPQVYFFGGRMSYYSHSTIRYLAPRASGTDVPEPLSAPPDWALPDPTVFIFLPERSEELQWVQLSYPGGTARWFTGKDGPLFLAYEFPG
jgi:4-amino-4-deoxy-L-arabinose transferase-like glycosyltransferase